MDPKPRTAKTQPLPRADSDRETLEDLLSEEAPVSIARTVVLLAPVAEALDQAHSNGRGHQGLTPDHLRMNDGRPEVDPTHLVPIGSGTDPSASGSLAYTSPEQLEGKAAAAAANDVWSLAVLAYRMIEDESPFPGAPSAKRQRILEGRMEPALVPDSTVVARELLNEVFRWGLDADAMARPKRCVRFLEALEAAGRGVRLDSIPAPASPPVTKKSPPALLAGALAIGVLALVLRPAPEPPVPAVPPLASPPPPSVSVPTFPTFRSSSLIEAGPALRALFVSRDGSTVVVGGDGPTIQVRHLTAKTPHLTVPVQGSVDSLALSPDGRWLAYGTRQRFQTADQSYLAVVELTTGQEVHRASDLGNRIASLTWSPDSQHLLAGGYAAKLWVITSGSWDRRAIVLLGGAPPIQALASAPESTSGFLYAADHGGRLFRWSTLRATSVAKPWMKVDARATSLVLPDTGEFLLTGWDDGDVVILATRTKEWIEHLRGAHRGAVTALAVSGDGSQFATGGQDSLIRLWSTQEARKIGEFVEHAGEISGLAFAGPRGRMIVSAGEDGSLRTYSPES